LVFVIGIIVFACSWATLDPREYAVTYHNLFMKVNRFKTAIGGRNFIGPSQTYIKFPRGLVGYYFNDVGAGSDTAEQWAQWMDSGRLSVWSKNGQTVHIAISLNVKLNRDAIPGMYLKYGTDPWNHLRVAVVSTMKNTAVKYSTLDFFLKRVEIKNQMTAAIEEMLAVDGAFTLLLMNLRSIDLPEKFESVILNKLLSFQALQRARYQQEVEIMEKGVKEVLNEGDADALISLVRARAMGDFNVVQQTANAEKGFFRSRSDEHRNLMDALNWTTEDDLGQKALHFYAWQSVQERSTAQLTSRVGVTDAKLVAAGQIG